MYSPLYGEVLFDGVSDRLDYPIKVRIDSEGAGFTKEGKYILFYEDSECLLFPSKKQRDWSKFKIQKKDLPIDTPVMVNSPWNCWSLRYYAGNSTAWEVGRKSADGKSCHQWKYIIPFDKFNPNDIQNSIEKYNYGTNQ